GGAADHGGAELAIEPRATVHLGGATLDARGEVKLHGGLSARATADARDVDLSALSPSAPESRLAAAITATAEIAPGGPARGAFDVDARPGALGGAPIPAARARGSFTQDRVTGSIAVREPGAPVEAAFDLRAAARRAPVIDFDTRVDAPDLARAPLLRG